MQLVEDHLNWFRFRVDQATLDFFSANRIRSREFGEHRWKVGDILTATKKAPLERYLGIFGGMSLPSWGAFSYSFSDLGPWIQVGRYCSISWNVRAMGPHHGYHLVSNSEILYRRETSFGPAFKDYGVEWTFLPNPQKAVPIIGNDVWIGQDVLLGRNIRLGDGCVVGAGSVVTKDVAPYAIVGGVPARVIKYRFTEKIIERMLSLQWWDYALPELNALSLESPERFVDEMANLIAAGRIEKMLPLGLVFDELSTSG